MKQISTFFQKLTPAFGTWVSAKRSVARDKLPVLSELIAEAIDEGRIQASTQAATAFYNNSRRDKSRVSSSNRGPRSSNRGNNSSSSPRSSSSSDWPPAKPSNWKGSGPCYIHKPRNEGDKSTHTNNECRSQEKKDDQKSKDKDKDKKKDSDKKGKKRDDDSMGFIATAVDTSSDESTSDSSSASDVDEDNYEATESAATALATTSINKDDWIPDSGASDHMSNNRSWFVEYTPLVNH